MHKILSSIFSFGFLLTTVLILAVSQSTVKAQDSDKIKSLNIYLDSLLVSESEISASDFAPIEKMVLNIYNEIYSDTSGITEFENKLKDLIADFNSVNPNIKLLQVKLNSLKQNRVSLLPAFYKLTHKTLQEKIYQLLVDEKPEGFLVIDNEVGVIGENLERLYALKSKIEQEKEEEKNALDGLEIQGLIVNETQTKIGSDFYDLFYSKWQEPQSSQSYTIIVSEEPAPGMGTRISVAVDENLIFQQRMQPRYEVIEEMSGYAVQAAAQYIANYEDIQKQLQGDDLAGSGIF